MQETCLMMETSDDWRSRQRWHMASELRGSKESVKREGPQRSEGRGEGKKWREKEKGREKEGGRKRG